MRLNRLCIAVVATGITLFFGAPAANASVPTPPPSPAEVSRTFTAAPDGLWEVESTVLTVTPAPPPPPPPPPTPQELAGARALVAASFPNGQIPVDLLCELTFAPGHHLRCDAQLALEEAFVAGMPATGLSDSYRTLEGQVAVATSKPALAATPGRSEHGLGLAIDVHGPMQDWLHEHGAEFGWINPQWAKTSKYEPWHFEFETPQDSITDLLTNVVEDSLPG